MTVDKDTDSKAMTFLETDEKNEPNYVITVILVSDFKERMNNMLNSRQLFESKSNHATPEKPLTSYKDPCIRIKLTISATHFS